MESESDIPFAGLAELVTPLLAHLDEIPAVQADALRGALALGPADARPTASRCPPRCSRCSPARPTTRPVLAVVDDAQWLDEPSLEAFLFAGRRLRAGGRGDARRRPRRRAPRRRAVAGAAARRAAAPTREARGAAGRGDRARRGRPAGRHRRRQPAGAAGDPRAAVAPRSSPAASRWRTRCGPGTGVERAFAAAVEALPEATRRALLVAAAAGTRRLDAIGRGLRAGLSLRRPRAGRGGADRRAGRRRARVPPSAAALDRLPRGVAGRAAGGARGAGRRGADGAERAWHLAACAVAPDEAVAAALEQAALDARGARRARHRGARPRPRRAAHARRRAARAAAAGGGRRRRPLRRGRARARAARRGGGADRRPAAGRRRRAPARPRRDAPRARRSRPTSGSSARPSACARAIPGGRRRCSSRRRSRT